MRFLPYLPALLGTRLFNSTPSSAHSMSWRCSANSNDALVSNMEKNDIIKTRPIGVALRSVDRACYSPSANPDVAYADAPQPIGYGATISAPHMHAVSGRPVCFSRSVCIVSNLHTTSIFFFFFSPHVRLLLQYCLELLHSRLSVPRSPRVLDVGCGSGYLSVLFARLNPSATVFGIDYIQELVDLSRRNAMKKDGDLIADGRVTFIRGDGWKGYPEGGPYDVIQ